MFLCKVDLLLTCTNSPGSSLVFNNHNFSTIFFSFPTSETFQITALTCISGKVVVGTTIGVVAIFDSETTDLIVRLNWHQSEVLTLMVMPKEINSCICAEVPFPNQEKSDALSQSTVVSLVTSMGIGRHSNFRGTEETNIDDIFFLTWQV
jgi:hypothetical protein